MIGLIIGNILLGMGVGLFKSSAMGNDPFSAMIMSVSALLHLPYATYLILFNCVLFVVEIAFGRKYIGIGTFVNWFLIGYVATFCIWLAESFIPMPESFLGRIPFVLLSVIVTGLGVSFYQTSDAGIAPYDSLAIIFHERVPKLPYFWCRMICDGTSALICLLTGGLIGFGTFLCAFCLGPVIHFFNKHLSEKLLYKKSQKQTV